LEDTLRDQENRFSEVRSSQEEKSIEEISYNRGAMRIWKKEFPESTRQREDKKTSREQQTLAHVEEVQTIEGKSSFLLREVEFQLLEATV